METPPALDSSAMKHWDGRDVADVSPAKLSPRDRQRIRDLFEAPPRTRRRQPQIHSVIGLALAVGVLVGLAWALSPSSPVSSKLLP